MQRHKHIKVQKYFMCCSQTFQFVANRQENILRKYDECLICLLLFVCQPVYLCEIYALQFFLIQKQANKAGQSGSLGGLWLPQYIQNIVLYSCDAKAQMHVCL